MAESVVGAEVNGTTYNKNYHTNSRSIASVTKEDPFFIAGEAATPIYTAAATSIATTTSASHLIFIQGDGTNYTRLRGIDVEQATAAAGKAQLQILRTTTAGSGGSAISAYPSDGSDTSPYAGTIQTLPSSKGTEGVLLLQKRFVLLSATPTTGDQPFWQWRPMDWQKPLIIAPATSNGLVLKIVTGIATSTLDITLYFSVTSYL